MTKKTQDKTCPVCRKKYPLEGGRMLEHQHQESAGPFREGDTCLGSGHLPLEVSKEGIQALLEWATKELASLEETVKKLLSGETTSFSVWGMASGGYRSLEYTPEHPKWSTMLQNHINGLESDIEEWEELIETARGRLAG